MDMEKTGKAEIYEESPFTLEVVSYARKEEVVKEE